MVTPRLEPHDFFAMTDPSHQVIALSILRQHRHKRVAPSTGCSPFRARIG
jgi:hypothetical protein